MSITTTQSACIPCLESIPCPPPAVVTLCVDGEPCVELTDAKCVSYLGPRLANIDVNTDDRLDNILEKLNINNSSEGIDTEDTDDIHFEGSGVVTAKLKGLVKVNEDTHNIIEKTSTGLLVKFNKENLLQMMVVIASDSDLTNAFCMLVGSCNTNGSCGIATNLNASMN